MPEKDQGEIYDFYGQDLHMNQVKYPGLHRTALLITICAFVEDQLNELCKTVSESLKTNLKLCDISGKGIERALTYLSKAAEFDLGKNPALGDVRNANRLRNVLVHAGGLLPENANERVNKYVHRQDGLRGQPGNTVSIAPSYLDEFTAKLIEFFDSLNIEVNAFMHRVQLDMLS